ncbi:MAG: hypothetical protein ACJ8FY_27955 [Gemmataceae bacterium]
MSRLLCCTMLIASSILTPAALSGCDSKGTSTSSSKDTTTASGKDKSGSKPTPPERDPG